MNWKRIALSAALTCALTLPQATIASAAHPSDANMETLLQVYDALVDQHYSHPDPDKLLHAAIEGMLDAVGDPYTTYMSPDEYHTFVDTINQQYAGVGMSLQDGENGQVLVEDVYARSPAQQAGLQPGDVITAVDGAPDGQPLTAAAVAAALRGKAGTSVTLRISRGGAEPAAVTLTRAEIQLPTVTSRQVEGGVTYIRIYSFGETTGDEFGQALADARTKGPTGLILDLRGNGGGYVVSALQIADMLLPKDATIITVHDEGGRPQSITAGGPGIDLPIVLLVDGYSASASEILAGALQKDGAAKLVGSRTFGKGSMQMPKELPNGGVIKLSIDRWTFADGSSNDHVGLAPDIAIQTPSLAFPAALEAVHPAARTLAFNRRQGTASLDGNLLGTAPALVEEGGRTYLPLRYTLEALGIGVGWNAEHGTATATVRGASAEASVQTGSLAVDGLQVQIQGAIRSIDGRTYIAAEAMARLLGSPVEVGPEAVTIRTTP